MKFVLFSLLLFFSVSSCFAQVVYQIRADSVRIYNTCDTAELILENRTQKTAGFLYNKGLGRTEFRRLRLKQVNDTSLAIEGQDTIALGRLIRPLSDPLYIRQQSAAAQLLSNFWIDGTGRAGAFMTNNRVNSPHTVMLKPEGSISRWATFLYNPETGTGNQGSDFRLARYSDTGAFVGNVMTIERSTGIVTLKEGMKTDGSVSINSTSTGFRLSVSDSISAIYDPANKQLNYPLGTMAGLYNMSHKDSTYAGISFQVVNKEHLYQSVYMGIVSVPGNTYQSNIVIGQRTGPIAYTERLRIVPNGSVGIGTVSPVALLDVNGNVRIAGAKNNATGDSILTTDGNGIVKLKAPGTGIMPVRNATTAITLGANDFTVLISNTAAMTVTLPAAAGHKGRLYNIKKISDNTLAVTIQAQSGELIDGSPAAVQVSTYNKTVQLQSSGVAWYILN
ncbi:hypothetical protein MRBLMN1_002862 [Chitinophaga ginsengisegetis]|uniref:hypothetical protein n=1 Tax=Chitinophaga ginsengisegetis TaxID=393003 RepID=UPI0034220050